MKVRLCSWDWVHRTAVGVWLEEVSLYFNGYCKGLPGEFFRWKLFFCGQAAQSLIIALAFAAQHICYCRAVSPSVDFYNAIKISRLTKQRRLETLWGRKRKGGGWAAGSIKRHHKTVIARHPGACCTGWLSLSLLGLGWAGWIEPILTPCPKRNWSRWSRTWRSCSLR